MAFMICSKCGEQIDVTDQKTGAKIFCAQCSTPLVVEKRKALMDARDAHAAIGRARARSKKAPASTVKCPNCGTDNPLPEEGAEFRCIDCGQKVVLAKKPKVAGSSSSVAFPSLAPQGTLLDMEETKEAWGKPPKKKNG